MQKSVIQESTLYPDIVQYLKENGFNTIGETRIRETRQRPDIIFEFNKEQFILEVKLDESKILPDAIAQATQYAKTLGTENYIVLVFPKEIKEQAILGHEFLTQTIRNSNIFAYVATKKWVKNLKKTNLCEFVELLKEHFLKEKPVIDFETVVERINVLVKHFNFAIATIEQIDKITEEVVDKLDLFTAIGDFKDKNAAQKQILHLASFLLFNQILFYNIFQRKTDNKIPELKEIKHLREIQNYFDLITQIDYRSIYKVNILGQIPNTKFFVDKINELILNIILLRAEHISHDLAGRFFHELIPFEVRKVLAAFYTHPNAADLLAGICIETNDATIIDPACGSGTLLVAAYKRKQFLYEKVYGFAKTKQMHSDFVEKQITGIDIMPFAAHISTINLTMQNIEQITNDVRIVTRDSLEMANPFLRRTKDGMLMETYTETIQTTIATIYDPKILKKGVINANGENEGKEFMQDQVDAVIMNPPYSDRQKMPQKWLDKLKKNNTLNVHCGNLTNLWGYFLILGDILVKNEGFVGSVIPINFARGKATEKIREFILKNHTIRYIVKPVGDMAFSEGAAFKDMLLVTEKKIPENNDICKIVYFKESIRKFKNEEIPRIYSQILKLENQENQIFDIFTVQHSELLEHQSNLMYFLWAKNSKNFRFFEDFYKKICKLKKLINFPKKIVKNSISGAKGLIEGTFITNPMNQKCRVERAFMIFDEETENEIIFHLKKTNFTYKIPKKSVRKAFRTITGVKTMKISNQHDYFILENFADFQEIKMIAPKINENFDWEIVEKKAKNKFVNVISAIKFDPFSRNTSFLSFFSEEKFISGDVFSIYPDFEINQAKIFCMFYNSVFGLTQVIAYRQLTLAGGLGCIRESDLLNFKILDFENLKEKEIEKLLLVFENISVVDFPSIVEQIESRFPARVELDFAILEVLGYKKGEINELLPQLYDVVLSELKS